MNKNEFLFELQKKLKRLPQIETQNAINYYAEYFADAGVENEQKIITELGSPSSVASKIIGEYAVNDAEKSKNKGIHPLWVVILAIFASPIALPIAIAVAVTAFALTISLFAVFFSFGACGIAFAVSGIASIIAGIWAMTSSFPTGLFFIGYGMVMIPLGISVISLIIKLSKVTFSGVQKMLGKFLIRRGSK